MTHSILLTRFQGEKPILLSRDGVPKDPYRKRHRLAEEGRMTPTLLPFLRQGSLHSPTFCWMFCDPSIFYRIWFWLSADVENTKPDHDEKSLHHHTIPCFAWSKSPFELQLRLRETPYASHPETEEERCLRCNQRQAARAIWVRCEPSTPRRDPKTDELVVEGVFSRFFQPTAAARGIGHVCQARFVFQAEKGQRIPNKSPGERELGVVQEARSLHPIPTRADLLRHPAVPIIKRIRSGTHH